MRFLMIFFIMAFGVFAAPQLAVAGFEDDVAALAGKSFKSKIAAINKIAASSDERTVPVLEALLKGKLYKRKSDKKVVITEKKGGVYVLFDPLTAKEIGQETKRKLKKVRVNNKLRRIIKGALGGLTLFSNDAAKRAKAADAVFKSRPAAMIPLLEKALKRETDSGVKGKIKLALAATRLLAGKDDAKRLDAIKVLSSSATPETRALLGSVAASETDAGIKKAAQLALTEIEERLALWNAVGNVFQGISLGSVLLLAAVGLAITFGVMGVINMAHGELVMLGAYTTFIVQELFRTYLPGAFDYSLFVAVPAAFLVAGSFGIAIERGIIRFLYGRPLETLLATWGISLVLQQLVRTIFGPTNREVGSPSWMSGFIEVTGGLALTYNRIYIIVFSLLVIGLLALVMRKTSFGLKMRAVTQNRKMAGSMGIRTGWIDALTFGLGSGIAGVAGVALSQIDNVSPNLGQAYIIDSFMVVVFGGVGSLWGVGVGAFSLGLVNKFLEPMAGAVLAKIFVLIAIILFIQKRPRGLFALKGRAVEN
ncbi:MAG: urea ABC transporter permease subunit UrtB [Rhodospirillaceae bacterium]|jgi:urea transport system permease protein|nr:urea ABC transporter permease subunit UrtB [Rhodospirillaceae bacterium]|tara:strand:+ start:1801 stop:3411 length:1611 start_codon:yes stop_codon:yes gene_type:complete